MPRLKTKRPYNYKKLTTLLEPHRFWLLDDPDRIGYTHRGAAVWMRNSRLHGLYDVLICGAGPAAYATAYLHVIPSSCAGRGLSEDAGISELTIHRPNAENTAGWEERTADIAPLKCDQLCEKFGAALLASTAVYRANSLKYLQLCRGHQTIDSLHAYLQSLGPVDRKWLFDAVPFTFIPGANNCYICAALLLYWFAHDVENLPGGYRKVDCGNDGLCNTTMILASRFANQRGWPRTWQEDANR